MRIWKREKRKMALIDRRSMIFKLCHTLQAEYVALLGQRGIGIETAINTIMHDGSPSPGMKFMSVALPRRVNANEFKEIFLIRLKEAASRVPAEPELANNVSQTIQDCAEHTLDYRIT